MIQPEYQFITLTTKPSVQLCYSFTPAAGSPDHGPLVVFLNGLGMPQTSWVSAMNLLRDLRPAATPAMLTYDRFGQGQTADRDPQDADAEDPAHGHDCLSAVDDLRQLVAQVALGHGLVGTREALDGGLPLVLVGNSIGCALARLYAQTYPRTVAGMLLLDSVLANSDFVSIFPDPDAADSESADAAAGALPEGVTPAVLRQARATMMRIFHPRNGSREGLSRRNLASLLPDADGPKIEGVGGTVPWLTVAGHDPHVFAEGSRAMGMPYEATMAYANPFWARYNEGLVRCTDEGRGKGPLIVKGADHFIQKDRPDFVAAELHEILGKVSPPSGIPP